MDENGPAIISSISWSWNNILKEYDYSMDDLVDFQLKDGVPELISKYPFGLYQNPHQLYLKFNNEEKSAKEINLGDETSFDKLSYDTNADLNNIEPSFSEKTDTSYINEFEYDLIKTTEGKLNKIVYHPLYGKYVRENYGRWIKRYSYAKD